MPAKKPSALHTKHSTRAEIAARRVEEESLQSERGLPVNEPAQLKGHEFAAAVWRRLMREYNKIEARITSRLDLDLVVDYCILMEQLEDLDRMRKVAYGSWLALGKLFEKQDAQGEQEAAEQTAFKVVNLFDAVIKLDGRADRKRDMLLKIRQSLYLTPRARSGVTPKAKKEEAPEDPFEAMLNSSLEGARVKVDGGSGDEE